MSQPSRFKHESIEDTDTIIKYLTALKEGFENGSLLFSSEDRKLILKPYGLINLEIEAKRKAEEIKLTLKLKWSDEGEETKAKSSSLTIQPMIKS
ncbi:MAG: amphi-Trp domain-containing protein [Proteobacteria bacterium]|nr:amphi-Trp domain-containing protein [Pseudomonadota bacterium]